MRTKAEIAAAVGIADQSPTEIPTNVRAMSPVLKGSSRGYQPMRELVELLQSAEHLVSLEPEELGSELLFAPGGRVGPYQSMIVLLASQLMRIVDARALVVAMNALYRFPPKP